MQSQPKHVNNSEQLDPAGAEVVEAGRAFFASRDGSYLYGDSWRLSSQIKEMNIDIDSDKIVVYTESGSWYNLYKSYQGLRMSNAGIYNELKENYGDKVEIVEL